MRTNLWDNKIDSTNRTFFHRALHCWIVRELQKNFETIRSQSHDWPLKLSTASMRTWCSSFVHLLEILESFCALGLAMSWFPTPRAEHSVFEELSFAFFHFRNLRLSPEQLSDCSTATFCLTLIGLHAGTQPWLSATAKLDVMLLRLSTAFVISWLCFKGDVMPVVEFETSNKWCWRSAGKGLSPEFVMGKTSGNKRRPVGKETWLKDAQFGRRKELGTKKGRCLMPQYPFGKKKKRDELPLLYDYSPNRFAIFLTYAEDIGFVFWFPHRAGIKDFLVDFIHIHIAVR